MADIIVDNATDENDGIVTAGNRSLREAIGAAVAGDRILFDAGVFGADIDPLTNTEIDLTLGTLTLSQGITIDGDTNGDGIADVTIDGSTNGINRIFLVSTGTTGVAMDSLTLVGGYTNASGGAIYTQANSELSITNATFDDNQASFFGGAIRSHGDVTIVNSTFTRNESLAGGAISHYRNATMTIMNSTFSENHAQSGAFGGGAITTLGDLEIINSTISGNYAFGFGGGVRRGDGTLTLTNTIVAGNEAGSGSVDVQGSITTSNGANIFGSDVTGDAAGDIEFGVGNAHTLNDVFETVANVTVGPATFMAGIAANNGGPTQTIEIYGPGLAVNGGDSADVPTEVTLGVDVDGDGTVEATQVSVDQRGLQRSEGAAVDIGAVEKPFALVVDTTVDEDDGDYSANDLSLREALGLIAPGGTITFDPTVFLPGPRSENNTTITLALGDLAITQGVTIDGDTNGDGRADVTISGNNASRAFDIDNASGVVLDALTIQDGRTTNGVGGGGVSIAFSGVTIRNSTIKSNETNPDGGGNGGRGGGIYSAYSTLDIENSVIWGNSTSGTNAEGGGIAGYGGLITLTNTTVYGNHTSGVDSEGGGIVGLTATTTINLTNSTVTGNSTRASGGGGGGIYANGDTTLLNSIVLGNASASVFDEFKPGSSSSFNQAIIGDGTGNGDPTPGLGLYNASAASVFESLAFFGGRFFGTSGYHGGPVRGVALKNDAANAALDAGADLLAPVTDARGVARADLPGIANNGVNISDIGALELAQTVVVDTVADEDDADYSAGDLSLREALSLVAEGGTITFDPTLFTADADERTNTTIGLTQGELTISDAVTINGDTNGDGIADVTIDGAGNGVDRSIQVASNTTGVNLESLTLTGADAGSLGGALFVGSGAAVTIRNATFDDNESNTSGGAIYTESAATLTIVNSTFTGNSSANAGGGAIHSSGTLNVLNSTFSGNSTGSGFGGAIHVLNGTANLFNTTISGNYAAIEGGGIARVNGTLNLTNSIVAGNKAGGSGDDIDGTIASSNGANIFGSTVTGSAAGDLILGAGTTLADVFDKSGTVNVGGASFTAGLLDSNGGPVDTAGLHADPTNPALDVGPAVSEATLGFDFNGDGDLLDNVDTDARGFDRTVDIPTVGNDIMTFVDVGAFEMQIVPTEGPDFLTNGPGSTTIQALGGNDLLNFPVSNPGDLDDLDGGADTDTVDFSDFEDAVWVDLSYTGSTGIEAWTRDNATVTSGAWRGIAHLVNVENLIGTAFSDELYGDAAANIFRPLAGTDRMAGETGDDTFVHEGGFDTADGGGDTDTSDFSQYQFAVWIDLSYSGSTGFEAWTRSGMTVTSGSWLQIADLTNIENLIGSAFDDEFYGDAGNNRFDGLGGDDRFFIEAGFDTVDGGADTDTADFSTYQFAVWVDLSYAGPTGFEAWTRGNTTVTSGAWQAIADLTNVENLTGTAFSDELYGDAAANIFRPLAGNDRMIGETGNDTFVHEGGFDTVDGGGDTDTSDFSTYQFAVWVDLSYAGPTGFEAWTRGNTTVTSGAWQAIADLTDIENLTGTAFSDELYGDAAANIFRPLAGTDRMTGETGDDTFVHEGGFDTADGGGDTDTSDFSTYQFAVWVDLDYDIRGFTGIEAWTRGTATVTAGNWQAIAALSGIENLIGSAFDDRLLGDGGNNLLRGGSGNDAFAFRDGFGTDTVSDFQDTGSGFEDVLDFTEHSTINSFADITGITVVSGNTQVTTADGLIILLGVTTNIAVDDFVF